MVNNKSFKSELDSRLASIMMEDFIAPSRQREALFVVVDIEFDNKIKRLHTLQKLLESECAEIAPKNGEEPKVDYLIQMDFCDIVGRILRQEIWRQYPALANKPFVICSDWAICREESRTAGLFKREPVSNRSEHVRPDGVRQTTQ